MKVYFHHTRARVIGAIVVMVMLGGVVRFATPAPVHAATAGTAPQAAWTSSMSYMNTLTATSFTCRYITRPTIAGGAVRVRLSNGAGVSNTIPPLTFNAVTVAVRNAGAGVVATPIAATFQGSAAMTIQPGTEVASDPIPLAVTGQQDVAVSVYINNNSGSVPETYHPGGSGSAAWNDTSYCTALTGGGNHAMDTSGAAFTSTTPDVAWVTGVDVYPAALTGTIVAYGDSITDGVNGIANANDRWEDVLAQRLAAYPNHPAVVNEGISGNNVCNNAYGYGPNGTIRLGRDALNLADVSTIILFEGTNDIGSFPGHYETSADVIGCDQTIISSAHARGIKLIGATILPRSWSATDSRETNRQQLNAWIRTPGNFDGVIDFDAAVRNPQIPQDILAPYVNSNDQTHPTDAGYAVMGHAIDLALFGVTAPPSMVDDAVSGGGVNQFNYHGNGWGSCANSCSSSTQYDGTEHWDATANDSLTINFTGTGIDFYAERGPGAGIAGFAIDSGSETTVDTYTAFEEGNQFVWSSGHLVSGNHTLKVRVTGQHSGSTTSAYVLPDRVDIDAATTTIDDYVTGSGVNQFNYHGANWVGCTNYCSSPGQYAGTEHWDATTGETVTITFYGTGIAFYVERGSGAGIAGFTIDGGSESTADTYLASESGNQFVWGSGPLANSSHTLTVRVTGQHDINASGAYVLPDAVQIYS